MKTIEEILAALQAILDGAEGRDMTEEELARAAELEGELETRKKETELRSRVSGYRAPVAAVVASKTKEDDVLERAFNSYLRTGERNADLVELRAQSVGTDSAGGYLVPPGFRQKITERMKAFGGLRNHVEVINTDTGASMEWPTNDDTSNSGEIVAEAGTFTAGADLVFGTKTIGAYKFMSGGASNLPVRLSVELLQDAAFDVESFLARKLGERIARAEASQIVTGNGTSAPEGIVTGVTGTMLAGTAALTYADLVTFIHSVDPAYRASAKWAFNDATWATIQKLEDNNGRPLIMSANDGIGGQVGGANLLGYPVVIDQAFSNINLTSNTVNWGVFGDLTEAYIMRRVKDITLVVDPYTRGANGQVQFHAYSRMDGKIQNSNAYIAMTGKA